jgi:hypothetical protein
MNLPPFSRSIRCHVQRHQVSTSFYGELAWERLKARTTLRPLLATFATASKSGSVTSWFRRSTPVVPLAFQGLTSSTCASRMTEAWTSVVTFPSPLRLAAWLAQRSTIAISNEPGRCDHPWSLSTAQLAELDDGGDLTFLTVQLGHKSASVTVAKADRLGLAYNSTQAHGWLRCCRAFSLA